MMILFYAMCAVTILGLLGYLSRNRKPNKSTNPQDQLNERFKAMINAHQRACEDYVNVPVNQRELYVEKVLQPLFDMYVRNGIKIEGYTPIKEYVANLDK